tara:strand:+ start:3141 stop:3314 length:174 start_codon:yes stop_codon:yes gene_type:complete
MPFLPQDHESKSLSKMSAKPRLSTTAPANKEREQDGQEVWSLLQGVVARFVYNQSGD